MKSTNKLLNSNASWTQYQEKFNEEYKKLECVIKVYKHSKIITEFSEDLWNGLLDKYFVLEDHIEFR